MRRWLKIASLMVQHALNSSLLESLWRSSRQLVHQSLSFSLTLTETLLVFNHMHFFHYNVCSYWILFWLAIVDIKVSILLCVHSPPPIFFSIAVCSYSCILLVFLRCLSSSCIASRVHWFTPCQELSTFTLSAPCVMAVNSHSSITRYELELPAPHYTAPHIISVPFI